MSDRFATRDNWLLEVRELQGADILTIHPLNGLTLGAIVAALLIENLGRFNIVPHGSKIMLQRKDTP